MENNKNIEVVNGTGKELDISKVYEHLNVAKPKMKKDKEEKIVIPKTTKN